MNSIPAEKLVTAVSRAMFRDPQFRPTIASDAGRDGIDVHARLDPFDMAPMIGKKGSLKFAMQKLIAHHANRDHWEVNLMFASTNQQPIERIGSQPPDLGLMRPVFEALCGMVKHDPKRSGIEMASTMVAGRIMLTHEDDQKEIGYHLHKLFRSCGRANGFAATLFLEHA